MQKPPIFSALRVQGKRLYEYAREGKEVPKEIEERPVEVKELEITERMEGGTHEYHWPEVEAGQEEKVFADKVLHLGGDKSSSAGSDNAADTAAGNKRKRDENDETVSGTVEPAGPPSPKRIKSDGESMASGAIPNNSSTDTPAATRAPCPSPACRIRMTVTSGFYVRSLCHDLGAAVGSLGLMAALVRTRQGEFELGKNVFEYGDLAKGEARWAPQVQKMLQDWEQGDHEGKITGNKIIQDVDEVEQGHDRAQSTAAARKAGRPLSKRRNSSSPEP